MTSTRTTFPEVLIGRSDPSWGDERERSILLDGYAYAYILATVTMWLVGAVIAWFIPGWVTVVLFLATLIPAMEFNRFCRARGVDANRLTYARASRARLLIVATLTGVCALSMACAAASKLIPDDSPSTMTGVVVGGLFGGTVAFIASRWHATRAEQRAHLDIEDEA